MPKLPIISGKQAIHCFEKLGYRVTRQRGSHVVLKRETVEGVSGCVVPLHRELAEGTLRGILRQAQVSLEEFLAQF